MEHFYPSDFVSYQFKADDSPHPTVNERLLSWIIKKLAMGRVRALRKMAVIGRASKVLDIGCGAGHFIQMARQQTGCQVFGVDVDEKSVQFCRDALGLNVVAGDIRTLSTPDEPYDLVTLWHVLEHEHDPALVLKKIRSLLSDDGRLVVEVPNERSLENIIFGESSYLYDVPRHLYHFSEASLKLLLRRSGFEMESFSFVSGAGGWIGTLQQLLFNGAVYKDLRRHVIKLIGLGIVCVPLDALANLLRRGSILQIVYRKRP